RDAKALMEDTVDVVAEFGFATNPIYRAYPDLWLAEVRAGAERNAPRTPESDEAFRKSVPPPGTVKLSGGALFVVRKFMTDVQRCGGRDEVGAIRWVEQMSSKGPNDAEWRKSGPGLSLGSYSLRQVPPDVIETIDGMKMVLSAPDPSIFVGK